ncbi:MAG: phosphate acyltransferase PlsX [Actinomycetota bacterium]|nr:phosphate acyltransferase PlsX [Actinomycetota bacterium]
MASEIPVTVCVDAMGGDDAPEVVVEGVKLALGKDESLQVLLAGQEQVVIPLSEADERVIPLICSEVIEMDEHPAAAVRTKRDSSIVVGCKAVKSGRAQGFFSAGSTGACLAAATLNIGRIRGIRRPALASVIPTPTHPVILCDLGANVDCKPEDLLQFGQMARIYAQLVLGTDSPSVALINNGTEETKGSQLTQEAYQLMKESLPGFAGNAEGGDVFAGTHDVFVTDGFTGNVLLKTLEGSTKGVFRLLRDIIHSSLKTKVAGALLQSELRRLLTTFTADAQGAAPLLGASSEVFVGHGSSNAEAIANGIDQTVQAIRRGLAAQIAAVATAPTKG